MESAASTGSTGQEQPSAASPPPAEEHHEQPAPAEEHHEEDKPRPAASVQDEHEYYDKTEKAYRGAKAKLLKLAEKEKSYKEKAEKKIAKLELALKQSDEQNDKNANKIKKLQAQKQKTETSVKKREATCDKEVKTAEAKAKSTREKLQKAVADFEKDPTKPIKAGLFSSSPANALFKLEDAADKAEQNLLAARKRREAVAKMVQYVILECQDLDNKCVEMQSKVVYDRQVNQYKLSQAQYERDIALAKLQDEIASAKVYMLELAVQQYEKRLARRKGALQAATSSKAASAPPSQHEGPVEQHAPPPPRPATPPAQAEH